MVKSCSLKLFSIECDSFSPSGYPVVIHNYEAETATRVHESAKFEKRISELLGLKVSKEIIRQMIEMAK